MKRQLIFGTMLSAALAVGVAAQEPTTKSPAQPPTTTQQPTTQPPSEPTGTSGQTGARTGADKTQSGQSMTLTGCLQSSSASSSAGASPTTGAGAPAAGSSSAARGGFILTDVKPAGSMAGNSTSPGGAATAGGATGTSGTASTGASTYHLTGGESQNLQQYVGQKVEVTGSVAGGAGSPSSTTTTPGAAGSPAGASASGRSQDQAFRVTSVRPTGDKCNQ